jgi:uncharacterized protein (TIGR04222 family)
VNPLDLRGPDFLVLYVLLAGGLAIVGGVLYAHMRTFGRGRRDAPDTLHPYALAFLAGGPRAAIQAAIVSGCRAGALLAHRTGGVTARGRVPSDAHPLDVAVVQAVHGRVGVPLSVLTRDVRGATEPLRQALEAEGLWAPAGLAVTARNVLGLGFVAVLALGAAKVFVGIGRDRPVGGLLVLLVLTSILGIVGWRAWRGRTARGDAWLVRQRIRYRELGQSMTEPEGRDLHGADLALAFGLFGAPVLLHESVRGLRPHAWAPERVRSGAASASGCGTGCGSSCGGGCGGSCGGGCGGCGG